MIPMLCIISVPVPSPRDMGIMEITVVSVVIRIGRSLVFPLSISASSSPSPSSFIRAWTPSTYRIPLFTTIPTSIIIPIMEIMVSDCPERNRSPKEPIRLKGMLSMTIREYFGDSNCMAITRNTRNTAAAIALPMAVKVSVIISSMVSLVCSTESGSFVSATSLSSAASTASVSSETQEAVMVVVYFPSCFMTVCWESVYCRVAISDSGTPPTEASRSALAFV